MAGVANVIYVGEIQAVMYIFQRFRQLLRIHNLPMDSCSKFDVWFI
jgi:hypothetical protein